MGQGSVPVVPIFGPDQPLWIRPVAQGDATGLDFDNAADPSAISGFLPYFAAGTDVLFVADDGAYTIDSSLNTINCSTRKGTAAAPVRFIGVASDGVTPMKAVFNGTRDAPQAALKTGTTHSGTDTVDIADTSGLVVGMTVRGSGIPSSPAPTILSITTDTSITLSANATGSGTNLVVCAVLLGRSDFDTSGHDLFDLRGGASYVEFANFTVNDMGSVFLPQADLNHITITDIDCDNFYKCFQAESDTLGVPIPADTFYHSSLTLERVTGAGFSGGGFGTWHNPFEIKLIDCDFDSEGQIQGFINSYHVGGTGRLSTDPAYLTDNPGGGPTFIRCTGANTLYYTTASNYPNSIYWNSDVFSDERTIDGALYKDCSAIGATDGGFDLKSTNVTLDGTSSEGCKFNYKLWGTGTLTGISSTNPVKIAGTGSVAHIAFFGATNVAFTATDLSITGGVGNSATVIDVSSAEGLNTLDVTGHTLSIQPGTTVVGTPTPPSTITVNWDPPLDAYTPDNTEAADLFAAMLAGGNALDDTNKALVDAAYTTLKANDALACFDLLYIWPATTAQDQALYNWVDPSAHKLTPQGGVAYDAGSGFHGNLVDGYLDSGLAANAATNYKQDDACIVVAVWDDVQRVVDSGAASSAMAKLVGRTTGNLFLGRLNASSDKSIANTNGQGVFVINKLDATHYEFDINGVSTAVTASGSTALTANNFTPLRVSGAFAGTQRQGAYGVGKHLTAQQKTDVYNAIRTLARAVDTSLLP